MPTPPVRSDRLVLAATPLILIATVLSATQGGLAGIATLALTLATSLVIARRVAVPADLRFVVVVALGTLVLRDILAGLLDAYLADRSAHRALFYDDAAYINYAKQMAEFWNGSDIGFPSDPSVRNSYAIGIGMLFSLIGENVMVVRLVNSFSLTVAALLTYRTMVNLGLPGQRLGLVGLLVFPSLALWSIVALKDTYVATWMVIAVWAASEYLRSGRYLWFLPTILALFVLDGARRYVFLVFALAWPLGLFLAMRGRRHPIGAGLAALCSMSLVLASGALAIYTPDTIGSLSAIRAGMARGARSALVDPAPSIRGQAGDRYLVTVADEMPECQGHPREVEVPVGTNIVVRRAALRTPEPTAGVTYVMPCDIIVLVCPVATGCAPAAGDSGSPGSGSPPPPRPEQVVVLTPEARNLVADAVAPPEASTFQRGIVESLIHLPVGVAFFLAAPFPPLARSAGELAAIPEMLIWYATLVFAIYGLYLLVRARDLRYAFGALALGGITVVLSLAEGNAGTLIRHRAMAIVFAVVFAAVGLDALLARRARQRRS